MTEIATGQIVFSGSEDKSSAQLGGAMPLVINAITDSVGAVRRRPGISLWSSFPAAAASGSPVIGMSPFGSTLVYVTEDRLLHAISPSGEILELSSTDATTRLDGGVRPSFVQGRNMLAIAGGGAIQKWSGTGLSERLQNTGTGGPPPEATHISGIAQRLVAKVANGTAQIWWSAPLEQYENWDMVTGGASYIQASAKPDPLTSLYDNTNEVFAFGSMTLQVFIPSNLAVDANDPNNLLDFAPSRTLNIGTLANSGVVPIDDAFGVPDRYRRIIITDGRSYNDISKSIAYILQGMQGFDECWGFRIRFGRFDCLAWMFPSDGYGIIWDANQGCWAEWRSWLRGEKDIAITSAYHWPEYNLFLIGMSDGSIAKLDDQVSTDLGDPIRIVIVSGFSNYGKQSLKLSRTVRFVMKRAGAITATSGHVRFSYRNDEGSWFVARDIPLGDDPNPTITIRSLGTFRIRQWKVEYTGSDEFQLIRATEEFENLEG